ncbi:helix-turn-helix domain-containing protein [Mammaliicoccus sciuri]|uniref:helix-turn-helix transcriptional regulator n=1 Tax=Mammaliicoccus sciuri TaxID=1296 RepID=UPI002DBE91D0|nr:helix-turn-helix transcriptional regulator [Mammaliicoccus sciuri]MEB7423281.1 helix-turn-helix domain-containing protein [Mammaliicoccus sciuri]
MYLKGKTSNIKKALLRNGLTANEFSKKIGYNRSFVSLVINAKRYPSPKTASIIAKELEMEIEDLFEIYEKEEV